MKTFVDVERMRGVLRVFSKECPGAAGRKEFERFAEKRLVSRCAHDPALRKAVDQKRRDPHLIEVFRPEFMTAIRSTGPVQQHHGGDLPLTPRGMRNSLPIVTAFPLLSPVRNCWSVNVSVGIARSSVRAAKSLTLGSARPACAHAIPSTATANKSRPLIAPSLALGLTAHPGGILQV